MNLKLLSLMAISASLVLVGCGGGSTSNNSDPKTGTSYYVDSAVSGIDYTCGGESGVTGDDGAFTFEVGASCTFYLGEMKLKDVEAGVLVDGEKLYETDFEIGRILQSLDSDGDPSNGITIDSDLLDALVAAGITKLPTNTTELNALLKVIELSGGDIVTEDDSKEHMLNTTLIGNTFYQHCKDDAGEWISSMTFRADGTIIMTDRDKEEVTPFKIIGGTVVTIETEGEEIHILTNITSEYIQFDNDNEDKFYFTKEAAEAAPAIDCGGEDTSPLLSALSGKTVYTALEGQSGTLESWSFSSEMKNVTWTEIVGGTEAGGGTLTVDGMSLIKVENGETVVLNVTEITKDYIVVSFEYNRVVQTLKLFFNSMDALSYYKTTPLQILGNKTLYTTIYQQQGTLESWFFNADLTGFGWSEIVGGNEKGEGTLQVDGFTITTTEAGEPENVLTITEVTSTYVNFTMRTGEIQKLFFNEADARDYYNVIR